MKKMINKNSHLFFAAAIVMLSLSLAGCKKFLDEKSNQKLAIPSTIQDLQALLDNYTQLSRQSPIAGEASADDYYATDNDYAAFYAESTRRIYLWQKDYLFKNQLNDWFNAYRAIYYSNTALERLSSIPRDNQHAVAWDNVKGQALFTRGRNFFDAAVVWCQAFDSSTAGQDLGLPLRLTTDFNQKIARASLQETFTRILEDLTQSIALLPEKAISPVRPSKAAAYGMLARVYLAMRNYTKAYEYSNKCLGMSASLMDFNQLSATSDAPIPEFNKEVIFESTMISDEPIYVGETKIDTILVGSYASNDLRKGIFYKRNNGDGSFSFKGNYEQGYDLFNGIATDEMYLIRAECEARQGDLLNSAKYMNTLLHSRTLSGTYQPIQFYSVDEAVSFILAERRKELVLRGIRWSDIKRLNKEGRNIILHRFINGQRYTLPANDLRYALPIPEDVVTLSGIQQNPR